jgi:hypothetical protein
MRTIFLILLAVSLCCVLSVSAETVTVAQGDPVWTQQLIGPGGTCWVFPSEGLGESRLYDQPAIVNANNTWCHIDGDDTANFPEGIYYIVYEAPAWINGQYFKDVSWDSGVLHSSMKSARDVNESGFYASRILQNLKDIITSNGLNTYSQDIVLISRPNIAIKRIERTATDAYTISGNTNLKDGENLTVYIDDLRYRAQHNASFTYHTNVIKPVNESAGYWEAVMKMPINDMPAGWHTADVYGSTTEASVRFKIDQQVWGPAPTPTEYVNYLSSGDIAPVIVNVTVTIHDIKYIDHWNTATPTPEITDALGGKINYPYSTGDVIPPWVGILGLVVMAGVVLVAGWKKK